MIKKTGADTCKDAPQKRSQNWKPKKRVRFAEDKNKEVVVQDQVNEDDRWYSQIEYQRFLWDVRRTLAALRKAGDETSSLDSTEYCLRGLEKHRSPEARALNKVQNREFVRLIALHHYSLSQAGVSDPDGLKEMSSTFTDPTRMHAIYLASQSDG
jgi:hypothetical protein